MHRDFIETMGWHLVLGGLTIVFVAVVLALSRSDDASWQAFALIYGFSFAMIYAGFKILRRVGAWPPRHTNRP